MYIARLYDTSLLTAEQERHLFRQMNYLLYRANRLRRKLDPAKPNRALLEKIQDDLAQANAVKGRIIQANLRLVVSIAKKFVNPANSLEELISDGNLALIRAVEKFNYGLGNRFSTYATYAVQRNYFRMVSRGRRQRERFLSDEERLAIIPQAEQEHQVGAAGLAQLQQSFGSLLQRLNPRERQILERRFGFHGQNLRRSRNSAKNSAFARNASARYKPARWKSCVSFPKRNGCCEPTTIKRSSRESSQARNYLPEQRENLS